MLPLICKKFRIFDDVSLIFFCVFQIAPQGSSEGVHLASPVQELIGTTKSFEWWSDMLLTKCGFIKTY